MSPAELDGLRFPAMGIYGPAPGRESGQSLPIWFTNTATAPKSEAVRKFEPARNWTRSGIAASDNKREGAGKKSEQDRRGGKQTDPHPG
jgi:hypothetical protein